jgi:hypothetical protein
MKRMEDRKEKFMKYLNKERDDSTLSRPRSTEFGHEPSIKYTTILYEKEKPSKEKPSKETKRRRCS